MYHGARDFDTFLVFLFVGWSIYEIRRGGVEELLPF